VGLLVRVGAGGDLVEHGDDLVGLGGALGLDAGVTLWIGRKTVSNVALSHSPCSEWGDTYVTHMENFPVGADILSDD
jgi:hypothetical protein